MKPFLLLLACVTGLVISTSLPAAPAPTDSKTAAPNVTLQAKSVDELLGALKATVKQSMPDSAYNEFEKHVLGELAGKTKGIDTKKPFGLYATLGEGLLQSDFSKSSAVILIPVANEKDFVELLEHADIGWEIKKKDTGYSIAIPDDPVEGFIHFLKGYAYISFSKEKLNPQSFLDPKELFSDKEAAAVALRIRIDRLPDDLKNGSLAFLAQATDAARNSEVPPEWKELVDDLLRIGFRWSKMGLEDGKELIYRIDLDQKSGAFVQETTLEAKTGTALGKSFNFKPTKNDFAGIVGPDSAAHVFMQTPLFVDDVKKPLSKLIVVGAAEIDQIMQRDAPQEARDAFAEFFRTLGRTVDDGNLDLAASLRGPDKNEQYTAVGAFTLKDTAALEKSLKAMTKVLPKMAADLVKVDAFKVESVNVHEIAVGELLSAEAAKIFSKSSVYVALAPNAVFVAFGAQAKGMMKEMLTQKLTPQAAPLVEAEVSGKRLMPLWKQTGAPPEALELFGKFAVAERTPLLKYSVAAANNKLVIRQESGLLPFVGLFGVRAVAVQVAPPQAVPVAPPVKAAPAVKAAPKIEKKEEKKEDKKEK